MGVKLPRLKLPEKGIHLSAGYLKLLLILVGILLLDFVLGPRLKFLVVIFCFIVIASVSTFYYNFFHGPINFELVKLVTVLSSIAYGVLVGVLVGLIATILGRMISGRMDHRTITSIIGIAIIAVLASIFSSANIALLGTVLVVIYHVILTPVSIMMGDNIAFVLIYAGTNTLFNAMLFSRVAPFLLATITF